jgi:uncharacterized protein (TIGR04255 family)
MPPYETNYITNVIVGINFSKTVDVSDKLIAELKALFNDDFPDFQNAEVVALEVTLSGKEKTTREVRNRAIRLVNKTDNSSVNLEPDSISIEVTKYQEYENIKRLVVKLNSFLNGSIGPVGISRLGLRYINQIKVNEGHPLDWSGFIDERLLQPVNFIESSNEISRAMGTIELNKTEYNLRFNYGWFNSEYPNPIVKKEFVLDYDCYSTNMIEVKDLIDNIGAYHETIRSLFKKSIGPKLIQLMERR